MFHSEMNQNERLKDLVAWMVIKHSYWGYLFTRVRRIADPNLHSIMGVAPCKDGTILLLYHPILLAYTDDATIIQILEHEGMHLLNKHISRLLRILVNELDNQKRTDKIKIWNTAADCAVNTLIDIPRVITVDNKPFHLEFPDHYKLPAKKATEYYYFKFLEMYEKNRKKQKGKGKGKGSVGHGKTNVDDHSSWGEVMKQSVDPGTLSRKLDGFIEGIVKDSIKSFERKRGHLPSHISQLIDQALAPPKVPYYQLIKRLVKGSRLSKFKRAFSKVNRKRTFVFSFEDLDIPAISPFPGRTRDFSFKIVVLIDTSGSMQPEDIAEGLSGIKNIIENDRHTETIALENDAELQKEYTVKHIRDIDFEIKGRGGTVLQPGLERARETNPEVCLVFTDGYCDVVNNFPRKMLPKKLIWVIQENGTAKNVNQTGIVIRI